MGLTAFIVFVLPWVALAVFLTSAPTVLRLGTAPAPWRSIPTPREVAREHRRETHPHNTRMADSRGAAGQNRRGNDLPQGGALGTSMEPTEPTDKLS